MANENEQSTPTQTTSKEEERSSHGPGCSGALVTTPPRDVAGQV